MSAIALFLLAASMSFPSNHYYNVWIDSRICIEIVCSHSKLRKCFCFFFFTSDTVKHDSLMLVMHMHGCLHGKQRVKWQVGEHCWVVHRRELVSFKQKSTHLEYTPECVLGAEGMAQAQGREGQNNVDELQAWRHSFCGVLRFWGYAVGYKGGL